MDSSDIPSLVSSKDLRAEISEEDAHKLVGGLVSNFIGKQLGQDVNDSYNQQIQFSQS
jgi:hypothetical protein